MSDSHKRLLERSWEQTVSRSGSTGDPKTLPYDKRVAYWRDRLPVGYASTYDRLLDQNCAPKIAAAVCRYAAGETGRREPRTQAEVAAEYDTSETTLRKWHKRIR